MTIPLPAGPGPTAAQLLEAALAGDDQLVWRLAHAIPEHRRANVITVMASIVADHGGGTPRLREALQRQLEPTTPDGAA